MSKLSNNQKQLCKNNGYITTKKDYYMLCGKKIFY